MGAIDPADAEENARYERAILSTLLVAAILAAWGWLVTFALAWFDPSQAAGDLAFLVLGLAPVSAALAAGIWLAWRGRRRSLGGSLIVGSLLGPILFVLSFYAVLDFLFAGS
ncbi:hypothetical protein [Nocardioides sp. GXZ039]|uniref:hypothetical protein n=1 Tax=Nocardioides sp. GXZ039 TaxID=3136018 RepID=UPI0030F3837B